MKSKAIVQALFLSLFAIVAVARDKDTHSLVFELRVPKTVTNDPLTRIELTTESDSSGTRLDATKLREEGDFRIYQHHFLLFAAKRRAIIVESEPSQVFVLSIPRDPKPADWSQWRQPDYVTKGHAGWDFMNDQNKQSRSTNAPPNCFQLRFKVEKE